MKMKTTGALLLTLSSLLMASTASAATAFTDPTALGLGWDRGDAQTSYAAWDVFDSTTDATPDVGSSNIDAAVVAGSSNTILTGTNNLYAWGGGTESFTLLLDPSYTLGSGTVTVALQLAATGTLFDHNSVQLDGIDWTSTSILYSGSASQGSAEESLYIWENVSVLDLYTLSFMAAISTEEDPATGTEEQRLHLSLGEVSIDIGNYAADIIMPPSAVPVPAALFMFGPALLGFMGLRRKVKNTVA